MIGDEVVGGIFQIEPNDSSCASPFIGEQPHNDDEIGDDVDECQNESFPPSLPLHMLPLAVCIDEVEFGLFDKFHNDLSPQIELALLLPLITLDSPFVNDK
jgi:hypothetical protein